MIGLLGKEAEMTLRTFQCLAGGGETVHLIGQTGNGLSIVGRLSRHCHGVTELDLKSLYRSPAKAAEALQGTCQSVGIDLLIPIDLQSTILIAEIKDQLKGIRVYPCSGAALIRQLACKLQFARMMDRFGLPQPEFWELNDKSEIEGAPWAYPVVIKPLGLENSLGVKVCNDATEAVEHFKTLQSLDTAPYLVQSFVPGVDIDLTVLADHGKVVAWAIYTSVSAKGGGKIHRFLENPAYLDSGIRLVEALDYHGIMHLDGRGSEQEGVVKMIECNPRMFGSVHTTSFAGINFARAGIAIARESALPPLSQINGDLHSLGAALALCRRGRPGVFLSSKASCNQLASLLRDPLPVLGFAVLKRFGLLKPRETKQDSSPLVQPKASDTANTAEPTVSKAPVWTTKKHL